MQFTRLSSRNISILLICSMLVTFTYTTYKSPQEVKAIAIADDALFIIAILGALGISYIGTLTNDDRPDIDIGWGNTIKPIDEQLGLSYNEYLLAEGFDPNNDNFDPNNDDPNDKPPSWEKFKEWFKKNGNKLKVTAGGALATVLGKFGYDLYKQAEKGKYQDDASPYKHGVPDEVLKSGKIKYFAYAGSRAVYASDKLLSYKLAENTHVMSGYGEIFIYDENGLYQHFESSTDRGYLYSPSLYKPLVSNVPFFDSRADANSYWDSLGDLSKHRPDYISKINPLTLPFSTDAIDHIKNNPDSDTVPVSPQTRAPTQKELEDFLNKIRTDPTADPQPIVNNFIQTITQPDTDPDPTPDPKPTPDPNPEPTVKPDPTPTPDPNPETDLTDEQKASFKLPESIKRKFPFCIPFDLIDCYRGLEASRKAPYLEWRLYNERYNIDYTFVIDLSKFETCAELCRTLFLLLFIIGLVMATRGLIKG